MRLIIFLRYQLSASALFILASFCLPVHAQQCLRYGPALVSFSGVLRSQVFPGPPNYESIRRGDRKETAIILKLSATSCVTGNEGDDLNVSETGIRDVQLVVTKDSDWKTVRRLIGKRAKVTGTLFHAHTGHHRTKVLIDVTDIRAAA
jgi:hypothetical protein